MSDETKKKLAELLERFGDDHRDAMIGGIEQMLRALADGAANLADQYARDEWAREWVEMTKWAASDLRAAASSVRIQPFAPHGEVPS